MCACENHFDRNRPCTCKCPEHDGVRREMASLKRRNDIASLRVRLRIALSTAQDAHQRLEALLDEETR